MDESGKLGNDDAGYVRAGFAVTLRDEHEEVDDDIDSERDEALSEFAGCVKGSGEPVYRPADPDDRLILVG